jgi:hypothetical protein
MVTLACLAAAGFMLGMFFNVYGPAASCVAVVGVNLASRAVQRSLLSPLCNRFRELKRDGRGRIPQVRKV